VGVESNDGRTRQREDAYLSRVHFELPHHLDGDLIVLMLVVLGAIDVAEGAITHLLHQRPPLQTGVSRQLAFALALLGDDALEDGRIVIFLLLIPLVTLLLGVDRVGGGMSGLGGLVAVVAPTGGGEGGLVLSMCLQGLVLVDVGVTQAELLVLLLCLGVAIVVVAPLLLGVDVGDVGSGLVRG